MITWAIAWYGSKIREEAVIQPIVFIFTAVFDVLIVLVVTEAFK